MGLRSLAGGAVLALIGLAWLPASGRADVALSPIGGSFDNPYLVTSPPGDTHRQFVLEKTGSIWLIVDGVRQSQPFVTVTHPAGEGQNIYSMAFAPDYASSGLFYVYQQHWEDHGSGPTNVRMRVLELSRSAGDPNLADPASERTVVTTDVLPFSYHLGGHLLFGPDGMLYVSTGDGDDFGNPDNSAQRLDSVRGKLLRLDPHASGGQPYTVPAGNPYPGAGDPFALTYARGLRNPWRFAFDQAGGILIADPGESRREEIDYAPAASLAGANFGWNCFEGTLVFDASNSCPGAIGPVHEYTPSGPAGCGAAIIGGPVVRDPGLPDLYGRYLYGDYCTGQLRSFALCNGAAADDRPLSLSVPGLTSFGEDGEHHVYVTAQPDGGTGSAARLVSTGGSAPAGCPPGAGGGNGATKDSVAPRVLRLGLGRTTFRAAARGAAISRRRVPIGTRVRFRLSEKATAKFTVQRRKRAHKRGRKWRYVRVRGSFSKRGKAGLNGFRFSGRLRGKKLAHARYRLTLVARDGAGNRSAPKRVRFRIVR